MKISNKQISNYLPIVLYAIFLIIMPILFSTSISFWVYNHQNIVENFGILQWLGLLLLACFTMALAFTPTTFVASLIGYYLGWVGLIPFSIAYWFSSMLGFYVAKKIDGGAIFNYFSQKPKVKTFIENLKKDEFSVIFLARLSPVLPFAISNLLLSIVNVKTKNFLTAGYLGMLPRTILVFWIATQVKDFMIIFQGSHAIGTNQIILIALILVSILGIAWYVRKASKKL